MARFNTFKYDDGTLYGTTASTNLLWTFQVAWDGSYNAPNTLNNEAARMVDFSSGRGRDYLIQLGGAGLEYYNIGEAVGIFENSDGRYDPWNTSSPLYPNVKPGKFVRILVKNGTAGTNYGIMRGIISDIQPFSRGRDQFVRIVVKDGLQWLKDRSIEQGLLSSNRIDTYIGYILTKSDWPNTEWAKTGGSIFQSVDSLDYYLVWTVNALDSIHKLESAELGAFFHDRDGNATFRGRDYTYERTQALTQTEILTDIVLPQPWEIVRNRVEIYSYPKMLDPVNTTLWQLRDVPAIANGATFNIDAIFRYSTWRPCGSSITFNHTVNAAADGSGADLTASCPLTFNTDIGDGAEITITNNPRSNGYITLLGAVGDAIYAPGPGGGKSSDTTSEVAYGPRTLTIDTPWQESTTTAQSLADFLLANLKDPNGLPTIQIEGRPTYQFNLDLYDRVELSIAAKGISANFRVGKIEHKWLNENGEAVR